MYATALSNERLMDSVVNSLIVAAFAVVICMVIGIPPRWRSTVTIFPAKTAFRRMVVLPYVLPGLITGVAMLSFFSMVGVRLSLLTVIIGHGTALTGIVVTNVYARLQRFDRRIEEASADLGAKPLQTFWYVTFPNIRSAVVGSSLIGIYPVVRRDSGHLSS